ncbi:hypothetical protein NE237_011900 [Protea cynaroides]|uniref:WAT1-related protein n=1 Tax=Protea cynaroides TaxID=273540 RepID=A0A9Q0GVW8_9MAGN|nr:hypothetical protein NE237_011900 [Protea cynaroides]
MYLFLADLQALEAYVSYFYHLSKIWSRPLPEVYNPEEIVEYFSCRPHLAALRLIERLRTEWISESWSLIDISSPPSSWLLLLFFVERKNRRKLTWMVVFQVFLCGLLGKNRPKLTWMVVFQVFLCGLFGGSFSQNLYLASLTMTSMTFATSAPLHFLCLLLPPLPPLLSLLSFSLTKMSERYASYLSSTTLMCLIGAIQSTLTAGVNVYDYSLGGKSKGPLFVFIFNPLMLVLVSIMGCLFLSEKLHFGSLIGAALIVVGLYAMLWGRGIKEMKKMAMLLPSESSREVEQIEVIVTTNPSSSPVTTDHCTTSDNNNHDPPNLEAATLRAAITEIKEENEEEEEVGHH